MRKDYFIKLVKNYCFKEHKGCLCDQCRSIINEYLNNNLDRNTYYKILSYNSSLFKRFHYYTFDHLIKSNSDDLTKN